MEIIPNTLLDQTLSVPAQDNPNATVPVPLLSGWLSSQAQFAMYPGLDVEPITYPLPRELAAIVRRDVQVVYIDQATARYMHGKTARFDWKLPRGAGLPPRLVSVAVSKTPLSEREIDAQKTAGRGEILLGTTFSEFIARYKDTEFGEK